MEDNKTYPPIKQVLRIAINIYTQAPLEFLIAPSTPTRYNITAGCFILYTDGGDPHDRREHKLKHNR